MMRAVILGGPDDGMEIEVMDDCRAFDHRVMPREPEAEGVHVIDTATRHYMLVRIDAEGRAVFQIERCAP